MPLKLRIFRSLRSFRRAQPARVRAVFTAAAPPGDGSLKPLRAWWVWRHVVGRAARLQATPRQRKLCVHTQGGCCNACKLPLPKAFQVDHIVPVYVGGGNEQANLQALHVACHSEKTKAQDPHKLGRDVFQVLVKYGISLDVGDAAAADAPAALHEPPPREVIRSERQNARGQAGGLAKKQQEQLGNALIDVAIAFFKYRTGRRAGPRTDR